MLGNVLDTVKPFIEKLSEDEPIGYIVCDLDYYSSTISSFDILKSNPNKYLDAGASVLKGEPEMFFHNLVIDNNFLEGIAD